jgi:hypothetical protein
VTTGLECGQRVRVHYNLRRRAWSVINPATGLVTGHAGDITLTGVRFRVQPAALARILATGRRGVCAYATGTITAVNTSPGLGGLVRVGFNPWRAPTFTCDSRPVHAAVEVVFADHAGWIRPPAERM